MSHKVALILALQVIAFWPVWRWYAGRVLDAADGWWSLLALATGFAFLLRGRSNPGEPVYVPGSIAPIAFVLLYLFAYPFSPPLVRALIAFGALGVTLTIARFGKRFSPGVAGLFLLSLPVIPSLQFYGGFPLRVFVAEVVATLLRLGGLAVTRDGACLQWGEILIWVDAPCSGVRMLWAGSYFALALAGLYELGIAKTLKLMLVAFVAIIAGNVFRATALFYVEAGLIKVPGWVHGYVGLLAFLLVGLGIVAATPWVRGNKVCAV